MNNEGDIAHWRQQERRRLLTERMAIGEADHRRWSARIAQRLLALIEGLPGRTIGLYFPVRAEFDPRLMADRLSEQGRLLALPAVIEHEGRLEYRLWNNAAAMSCGTYGIAVPAERRVVHPDVLLVPLLGFDAANYRLGYGGGYFDRTLAALEPRAVAVGAGFEAGRIETIFPQAHDVPMEVIATEEHLLRRSGV
jgi:5-formyltetrahydrofolate cyclo-ligase